MLRGLRVAVAAGALVAMGLATAFVSPGRAGAAPAGTGSNWTVYHHDGLGSGVDPSGTVLNPARPAWTSPALDGQIFGEPLVEGGRVIVATENDSVYALAANSGAVLWATHIATAVPSGDLPCGDIGPTVGITSTPVIDAARSEIFVVDDQLTGANGASHNLVGLNLINGAVLLNTSADPPGSHPLYQLQRAGLALDAGQVVIGFGGNAGDCETAANPYHGWLVALPEGGGAMRTFEVAANAGDSQGAIWMGGAAPIVDGAGNIWVATGNSAITASGQPYDNSDGVIELNSSLQREQFFAPSTWPSDNASDLDLGSSSPALLAGGLVFQAGKSHTAYVLNGASLGGVGQQRASAASYCAGDVDGGSAISGDTVYTPCGSGVVRTQVTATSVAVVWRSSTGAGGPPIIAGGLVWTIGGGNLYGLNPANGVAVQTFPLGSIANHFPTPAVADGFLFAPAANTVHAFQGLPPPPPSLPGPGEVAFQANTSALWTVGTAGNTNWSLGMAPGTSPSITALSGGGFQVAFQANTSALWTAGTAGTTNRGLGMAAGTSPSIAALPRGGYQVAFQANTGNLWTVGTAGNTAWSLGLKAGTSPSIAALSTGGFEVAVQTNGGDLWTIGQGPGARDIDWRLGMAAGTSPSITALSGGGFQVAFQANTSALWTVGSDGTINWGLGMAPGTSPSIAGLSGGGFQVAFQANTSALWTAGSDGTINWGLGMAPGTSPSIAGLSGGGFQVAFQANTTALWTAGSDGTTDWNLGMAARTSPAICGFPK